MSGLSIWLLGPVKAELDGKLLSGFRSDKVRALLAYLSMESHRPWARTTLAGLFWPNNSERSALGNLRNALSNLRKVLGDVERDSSFLDITQETIQFKPSNDSWLDVKDFLDLVPQSGSTLPNEIDRNHLERAVSLYRGDFMDGFSIDSPSFEEWMLTTRERLHQKHLQCIRLLVISHEQSGDFASALDWVHHWGEMDPWDENACRHHMQLLAAGGQRNMALAQYEGLLSRLACDLGVAPEPETIQLYERIRDGQPTKLTSMAFDTSKPGKSGLIDPGLLPKLILEGSLVEPETKLFVSRKKELGQLKTWLDQAARGKGGVHFVVGEPGSGKTALLAEFSLRAMQQHSDLLVLWGQCNAYTGQGDPYFPFLSITRMLVGDIESHLSVGAITLEHAQRLWKNLPETIASLMDFGPGLIDRFLAGGGSLKLAQLHRGLDPNVLADLQVKTKGQPQRLRQPGMPQVALFEQFSRTVTTLSHLHPLVIILDDLQWIDPGSLSLLFHLARQLTGSRLLLLGAYRSEEVALGRDGSPHPLEGVVRELQAISGAGIMDLAQSDGMDFVEALLESEPNALSPEFHRMLYQRTSGHPLFTIELLRGMQLRGDVVKDKKGKWVDGRQLNWDQLPVRVEAVIARRIHHLTDECQALLNAACVEGEQFTGGVVANVMKKDEQQVQALLSREIGRRYRLVVAQGLNQIGSEKLSIYRFSHSLFQTYLYNHLDAVERVRLHGRVGSELERIYCQDQDKLLESAHTIARHFESGEMIGKSAQYYGLAGKNALRLSANQEALAHFYHALVLTKSLPASAERDRQELELQLSLGHPLTALKGWSPPEMAMAYERAQELCRNISDTAQLIPALWQLATFRLGRSEHAECDHLVERLHRLAQQTNDPFWLALASLQVSPFYQGKFIEAREILERAGSFSNLDLQRSLAQQFGMAPAVTGLAYLAECLWILGFSSQARLASLEAFKLAGQIKHPLSSCYAFGRSNFLFAINKDINALADQAPKLYRIAQRYGFKNFELASVFFENWVKVMKGKSSAMMIGKMQHMLDAYKATGTILNRSAFLTLFAEACGKTGQFERGLDALTESIELAEKTGELWYQAEAFRVRGELLAQRPGKEEDAESCLLTARKIANKQTARMLELRATVSLCHLWDKRGKGQAGRVFLAQIFSTFTEGFDTSDLIEAKELTRAQTTHRL